MKIKTIKNRSFPAVEIDVNPAKILTENFIAPDSYNPHNVRPFYIGYRSGFEIKDLCIVWADSEQSALDGAVDAGMLDQIQFTDPTPADMTDYEYQNFEEENVLISLGNAGELFYGANLIMAEIELSLELVIKFVRAEERQLDNLYFND